MLLFGLAAILPPIFSAQSEVSENSEPTYVEPFLSGYLSVANQPSPKVGAVKGGYPNKNWPVPSKDEAKRLINDWVAYYDGNIVLANCLVGLESGFYSLADNKTSTAAGLWQIIKSTWVSTTKAMGVDWTYNEYVYNAEKNAQVGAYLFTHGGYRHWIVWPSCVK